MKLVTDIWRALSKPAKHLTLGTIAISAFIMGIIFWGGFNTALEATNTEEFCISCHEMGDNVYKELQETVHYSNHAGVRATCPDCHVPHNWTNKIARKMQASKEVFAKLTGAINTREKFLNKRLELASHEWARFEANGSLECKQCHSYKSMKWEEMSKLAQKQMKRAAKRDQSCLDCHKGIAHHLPDMAASRAPELIAEVGEGPSKFDDGEQYFSSLTKPLYLSADATEEAGLLNIATEVTVLETKGDRIKLHIDGWRKRIGAGRVIYFGFGINMNSAQLTMTAAKTDGVIKVFEDKVDEMTGLTWERVEVTAWTDADYMLKEQQPLWDYAKTTFQSSCSVCHTQPAENHFDANTWPGMFQGMMAFVNFDQDTEALVQKYLQAHSSTFSKEKH
ncbi:trimethylamine-N-oxide reductase cytochrome c-type subunit TorC [Sinobacterium caligoides]|uniref:Cytochrome c-type protein n=1 Tax=Sinobacterium caligoides TaxID=933926 RepID=A0A3N2DYN1_9GAMM|nr:pentaheme c-type cytochrome TorC [Sinobacterium caligoides]ROS04782.1 trimethylamine-N-oxide reductase cytochrome c-type subunit TorC [Sinobacterium caligoides]